MGDEALTAGAVARRLGVAVTTLRTWHQRYGLGPSHHVPGQHRRYTPEDMDRLEVMRRLTTQGVTPAEAAAWARRVPVPPALLHDPPVPEGLTDAVPLRAGVRDGGGNMIPTGRAGPAARGLARAAMRLDAHALREILDHAINTRGVVGAWEQVMMPVLIGIGERYEATRRLIEIEHLTSRSITEVLASVSRQANRQTPRVLLSCADEEQHTLPMEALAAALAEHGAASRLLGARVPAQTLADAVSRTGPAVVVVWSQLPGTADPAQLTQLLVGPRRPLMVAAAGPGWTSRELPDEVAVLGSLTEAVRVVLAAVDVDRQAS